MNSIFWDDSYATGIAEIDAQHKHLFELVYELYEAMRQGQGKVVLGTTLDGLLKYTQTHFAYEEKLMKAANYPGMAAHHQEHEALAQKVLDLQRKYREESIGLSVDTMSFLKDWLTNHIEKVDKAYIPYLKK